MDLPRSPSGFRSRRSYPSLNHISLAPLTPRFPIDDDDVDYPNEPQDYFSPRGEAEHAPTYSGYDTPPRTSYLSSFSVPGTPGVLSHSQSRSGSRARNHRHQRSKSTTREKTLSDTNLRDQAAAHPLHHHSHSHQHHHNAAPRTKSTHSHHRRDTEWMLRTASALASSAREEKGQSWLVKRASSTSLVSEVHANDADSAAAAGGGGSSRACRRSRSGRSTPAAFSRRGSLSRAASRRGSRPELSMTGLEMTGAGAGGKTGMPAEDVRHFVPDFVDERIRAEMEWIRQEEEQEDGEGYTSASSDGYFDSDDDIDEQEFQRLTRERGFGLGSWVDRVVGWTVFGDDDWPWASATAPVESSKTVEERSVTTGEHDDHLSVSSVADDLDRASVSDADRQSVIEKPGEAGGWEDAGWLFRTMKRAFF